MEEINTSELLSLLDGKVRLQGYPENDAPCTIIKFRPKCLPEHKQRVRQILGFDGIGVFLKGFNYFGPEKQTILRKYRLKVEYRGVFKMK